MRIPFISRLVNDFKVEMARAEVEARERRWTLTSDTSMLAKAGFLTNVANSSVAVTPDRAIQSAAVFACVRILAESEASLPFIVYRRDGKTREKAQDHKVYRLLHDEPNPEMSAYEFREAMQMNVGFGGNAYAWINWVNGWPTELWPLNPTRMQVKRHDLTREIYYEYTPSWARDDRQRERVIYPADEILHIKGPGPDGLVGWSPIKLAKESIGLGIAAEEFGARFFSNGASPSGVIEMPENASMTPDAQKEFLKRWEEKYGGLERAGRPSILQYGMTWKQISIAPEEAQFLETRKFQVTEIARFFRIPPHMIGDLDKATFSNIEHQGMEFVVHTLRPWLVRWEQAVNRRLFLASEQGEYYTEHLVDAFLRGDLKSRYEAYQIAIGSTFMSPNDAREKENEPPRPGGDQYINPNIVAKDQQQAPRSVDVQRAFEPLLKQAAERIAGRGMSVRKCQTAEEQEKFKGDQEKFVLEVMGPILAAMNTN